jgi:thioredoxin 1
VANPQAVGQRRKIVSHTNGDPNVYTITPNWTTTPTAAAAKYVVEGIGDVIYFGGSGAVCFTKAIGGFRADGNWSTGAAAGAASLQVPNRPSSTAAGMGAACWAFGFAALDAQKANRYSGVYLTRGGTRPPAPSGPSMTLQSAAAGAAAGGASGYGPTGPQQPPAGQRAAEPPRADSAGGATGKPITLTDATFDATLRGTQLPVLVDFWAVWCGPCKAIAPLLEAAASSYDGKLKVAKVDVDANSALAQTYKVRNIPTLLLFKGGEVVGQHVGTLNRAALDAFVAKAL